MLHEDANHNAIMHKIETRDIDETRKMVYRSLLEKTRQSTNGRTEKEKIQDMTESLAVMSQIIISRELDQDDTTKTINELSTKVSELQESNSSLQSGIDSLKKSFSDFKSNFKKVEELEKENAKPKTVLDKILAFLSHLPWSATTLGLGFCVLLIFRPEISELIKLFIK